MYLHRTVVAKRNTIAVFISELYCGGARCGGRSVVEYIYLFCHGILFAPRHPVKGVREPFSRLAVGAAENNSLALAVASVKAERGADGQQEDAPGGEAVENAGAVILAEALGP